MNLKPIHFVLYEFALLADAGFSILEACDAILASHKDEPEVIALFNELKDNWMHPSDAFPLRMVKPFAERIDSDEDFLFMHAFVILGSMTSMMGPYLRRLAYLFLLKRRVTTKGPKLIDVEAARSVLADCMPDQRQAFEEKMRAWSDVPLWSGISNGDPSEAFSTAWMDSFRWGPFDTPSKALSYPDVRPLPMPTMGFAVRHCIQAGMLESLVVIDQAWEWYVDSYTEFD